MLYKSPPALIIERIQWLPREIEVFVRGVHKPFIFLPQNVTIVCPCSDVELLFNFCDEEGEIFVSHIALLKRPTRWSHSTPTYDETFHNKHLIEQS